MAPERLVPAGPVRPGLSLCPFGRRGAASARAPGAPAVRRAARRAHERLGRVRLPKIEAPEAELHGEAPPPLFSTSDNYLSATAKLKADKALAPDDGDDDGEDL